MDNTLNDFQSSSSGSDKNDEDSFLTLSTKIVTFESTPAVCYFQMVESNKSQSTEKDGKKLTLKEKWKQSKLKKLLT